MLRHRKGKIINEEKEKEAYQQQQQLSHSFSPEKPDLVTE
jgi:hypothetical protein